MVLQPDVRITSTGVPKSLVFYTKAPELLATESLDVFIDTLEQITQKCTEEANLPCICLCRHNYKGSGSLINSYLAT